MPCNALAAYLWSCSISWCLATEMAMRTTLQSFVPQEGLKVLCLMLIVAVARKNLFHLFPEVPFWNKWKRNWLMQIEMELWCYGHRYSSICLHDLDTISWAPGTEYGVRDNATGEVSALYFHPHYRKTSLKITLKLLYCVCVCVYVCMYVVFGYIT